MDQEVKPGWKTTEFWASIVGHVIAATMIAVGAAASTEGGAGPATTTVMVLGVVLEICTLLGYQGARTLVKNGAAKAVVAKALAEFESKSGK